MTSQVIELMETSLSRLWQGLDADVAKMFSLVNIISLYYIGDSVYDCLVMDDVWFSKHMMFSLVNISKLCLKWRPIWSLCYIGDFIYSCLVTNDDVRLSNYMMFSLVNISKWHLKWPPIYMHFLADQQNCHLSWQVSFQQHTQRLEWWGQGRCWRWIFFLEHYWFW